MSSSKRGKKSVLTRGRMLANDGSDDSVDADPFARSKNEMANQIKKSAPHQIEKGTGERTVGKARSGDLCLLAEQNTCIPALKRILGLIRVRTTNDEPAPAPRNAEARTPSINVRLHMHLQKHRIGPPRPASSRFSIV
jgi:hypothetical protein